MILASVILKLGKYLRIIYVYIIKFIFNKFDVNLIIINLYGTIFLRTICLCQLDVKLIIAISSIVRIRIILMRILLITKLRLYGFIFACDEQSFPKFPKRRRNKTAKKAILLIRIKFLHSTVSFEETCT